MTGKQIIDSCIFSFAKQKLVRSFSSIFQTLTLLYCPSFPFHLNWPLMLREMFIGRLQKQWLFIDKVNKLLKQCCFICLFYVKLWIKLNKLDLTNMPDQNTFEFRTALNWPKQHKSYIWFRKELNSTIWLIDERT